ncbi:MAG: hypothetical protein ACYSWQ_10820 [Planctomycetota bacterium]|jgi:hypothetical protein
MKKILIIIGIMIAGVCICVFSVPCMFFLNNFLGALTPAPDLRRYVTQEELVGVWVPTAATQRIIAKEEPSGTEPLKCYITLHADGTCEFDSVYDHHYSPAYRKSPGTWTLEHDTEGNSNVRKKNAIAFDMESKEFAGNMYLNLKEKKGKLVLWEWHGDPDSWEFIEYVKEEIKENK